MINGALSDREVNSLSMGGGGILSPRTLAAANKQSEKLTVHKGDDNFNDDQDITAIISPKESK